MAVFRAKVRVVYDIEVEVEASSVNQSIHRIQHRFRTLENDKEKILSGISADVKVNDVRRI